MGDLAGLLAFIFFAGDLVLFYLWRREVSRNARAA